MLATAPSGRLQLHYEGDVSVAYQAIIYEKNKEQGLVEVVLNRPDKLNAINDTMFNEVMSALEEAERDPEIELVLFMGAGSSFSVGQDLSGEDTKLVTPPDPRTRPYLNEIFTRELALKRKWEYLYGYPKMTLARVHGYCLGAGLDLAMMCETSVVAEDAVLGDPSVRMGYATANPLWIWKVGPRKAKDLLLTGRYVTGAEAQGMGLVTICVAREEIEERTALVADALIHRGGMGGLDSYGYGKLFSRATWDAAGLGAAWAMNAGIAGLSSVQRRGFRPDEFNFWETREKQGMKAAIRARDERYHKLFPPPKPGS